MRWPPIAARHRRSSSCSCSNWSTASAGRSRFRLPSSCRSRSRACRTWWRGSKTRAQRGVVLFNRFYQPDFDIETLEVRPIAALLHAVGVAAPPSLGGDSLRPSQHRYRHHRRRALGRGRAEVHHGRRQRRHDGLGAAHSRHRAHRPRAGRPALLAREARVHVAARRRAAASAAVRCPTPRLSIAATTSRRSAPTACVRRLLRSRASIRTVGASPRRAAAVHFIVQSPLTFGVGPWRADSDSVPVGRYGRGDYDSV